MEHQDTNTFQRKKIRAQLFSGEMYIFGRVILQVYIT